MISRRRVRTAAIVTAVVVATGTGATAAAQWWGREEPVTVRETVPASPTVRIERHDLVVTREATGSLDFADPREISAARPGTLTWLPEVGAVLDRGAVAFRVDEQPVPVLLGETPLYRLLDGGGQRGADVQVIAENLVQLGYLAGFGEEERTGATFARALTRWRETSGLAPLVLPGEATDPTAAPAADRQAPRGDAAATPDTGNAPATPDGTDPAGTSGAGGSPAPRLRTDVIQPGDAVVLPAPVRVAAQLANLGEATSGTPVLRVTSTRKVVRLQGDAVGTVTLSAGATVAVVLPDGRESTGTVASVTPADAIGGNPEVVVDIDDQSMLTGIDSGPVTVRVTSEHRDRVLAVPLASLLALAEGGYALQREDGSLLGVQTGLFTDDLVEVSGEGLREGLSVVTAR